MQSVKRRPYFDPPIIEFLVWGPLKVSKSQKQISKFSFEPKNERFFFCISALASKMSQLKKIMAHHNANLSNYLVIIYHLHNTIIYI